jgi:hypothetical protein
LSPMISAADLRSDNGYVSKPGTVRISPAGALTARL